ncbi:hypothetical protein ABFX02_10G139700 [Erythranthe guttata]
MTASDNTESSYPPLFRPNHGGAETGEHHHTPKSARPEPDPYPDSDSLPVIDFRDTSPSDLGRVCREWGVFRLVNHGIPAALLSGLHEYADKVFSLSFETKRAFPTSPMLYFWGSPALSMSANAHQQTVGGGGGGGGGGGANCVQNNINWLEGFNVPLNKTTSDFQMSDSEEALLQSFRSLLEEYGAHQTRLAKSLFKTMAEDLNFPPNKSKSYLSPPTGFLRVYRYLRCHMAEQRWGINSHTDSSVISIIHQDQIGGLQIFNNNKWLDVKPIRDSLIVNLGDMMQAMSDDIYTSVTHRVKVHVEKERISIGYFVFPDEDAVIESSNYEPFSYADFQAKKEIDLKTIGIKIGLPRFRIDRPV